MNILALCTDAGIAVTLSAQLVYEFAAPDEALPSALSDGSSLSMISFASFCPPWLEGSTLCT